MRKKMQLIKKKSFSQNRFKGHLRLYVSSESEDVQFQNWRAIERCVRWVELKILTLVVRVKMISSYCKLTYSSCKHILITLLSQEKNTYPIQAKTSKSGREYFRLGAESYTSLGRVEKREENIEPSPVSVNSPWRLRENWGPYKRSHRSNYHNQSNHYDIYYGMDILNGRKWTKAEYLNRIFWN